MKREKKNQETNKHGTVIYDFIEERWKKEKFSFRRVLIVFMIILGTIILFNALRGFVFTRLVDIKILEKESVEFSQDFKGLILRNEEVIYASDFGEINKIAEEGERVARGEPVVLIEGEDLDETGYQDFEEVESEKNELKAQLELKSENITRKLDDKRRDKEDINEVQEKIKEIFVIEQALNDLPTKKEELEELWGRDGVIRSRVPGIVSYYYDGYESILTPERIDELSLSKIESLITGDLENLNSLSGGEVVDKGDSLFKIVDNYSWMISVFFDGNEINYIEDIGERVSFYPSGKEQIYRGKVKDYKLKEDKGALFVKMNRDIDEFWKKRKMELSLVTEIREGFNVPGRAMVEKDEEKGVYIINQGIVNFKPIEDLFRKDGKIYVQGLDEGEKLITNPRFLEDGDIVR